MYSYFSVKNYRRLRDLKLEKLGRINLFSGNNNVGKTSLLEALWLFGGLNRPNLVINIQSQRGIEKIHYDFKDGAVLPWIDIFNNLDYSKVIEFEGKEDGKPRKKRTAMYR